MSTEGRQDVLFEDPIGIRLRAAREKQGLALEQAGAQLKLPVAIIEAMEREDWTRLGAPIYVRSYLGSYLRLLGLPAELAQRVATPAAAPVLVPMASRSRLRRTLDTSLRNGIYLVMTAVLVVPVVLVARHYQNAERPGNVTLEADPSVLPALEPEAAPIVAAPAAALGPEPVMASITPVQPKSTAAAAAAELVPAAPETGLVLRFTGQSWMEVLGPDGRRVEQALLDAGAERRYAAGEVGHVTLGNAAAVQVFHDGKPFDLAPYRAANVARFAVSSEGEPAPARH